MITHNREKGLTLVELLVAMVIGLIVVASVILIFVANSRIFRSTEAMSGIQESARFAVHYMAKDVRMAGFQGCADGRSITPRNNVDINSDGVADDISGIFDMDAVVNGTDNLASGTTVGSYTAATGSDMIRVQYGGSCGGHLVGNMTSENANIQISANNSCALSANQPLIITDCQTIDIVAATTVSDGAGKTTISHATNVNLDNRLSKAYLEGSEVFGLQSYSYLVSTSLISGNPTLVRWDNSTSTGQELVEGVVDMQITYGADTDGDGASNYYVPAGTAGLDLSQVVSVKISMLVTSENEVAVEPVTYSYNGSDVTAGDRRIYKVFTHTIALRNHLN